MSEKSEHPQAKEQAAPAQPETGSAELRDDEVEDVAGGIIEGGCTEPVLRPWETRPTF